MQLPLFPCEAAPRCEQHRLSYFYDARERHMTASFRRGLFFAISNTASLSE